MMNLSDISWVSVHTANCLTILLDVSIKSVVVLVTACVLSFTLRQASAASRHMVWVLAMASLICLPILSLVLPRWQVPILPRLLSAAQTLQAERTLEPSLRGDFAALAQHESAKYVSSVGESEQPGTLNLSASTITKPESSEVTGAPGAAAPLRWSAWVLLAWFAGGAVVLMSLLVGTTGAWRMARRARRITGGSWSELLRSLAGELGLRRSVTLLQSGQVTMPMTWGLFRPVVLLPAETDSCSPERRRVVLLHELAHVQRLDCLTQMVAQLACVMYWFNPLAWLAAHRLRVERERACDDLVLSAGTKASDYAGHLLEIARSFRPLRCSAIAAVTMARRSQMEGRLLAILDADHNRGGVTRQAAILALAAVICVLLPLAAIQVVGGTATAFAQTQAIAAELVEDAAESTTDKPAPTKTIRQITDGFGSWGSGTLSLDGKYICDTDWDTGDLVVYELATGKTRRLTNKDSWDASDDYAWYSAISPDSKQVAYGWWNDALGFCDLRLIGMDGSEPRVLLSNKEISWVEPVQWSPDGKQVLARFTTKSETFQIVWVSVADGSVKVLKNVGKRWPERLCGSPDGRYIAYDLPQEKDWQKRDIFLLDIHENREIPLVKHPADDRLFGWSPDGKWILFGSDRAQSWDAWTVRVSDGKPQGLDELVMHGMARIHPKGFAPDGSFYGTMGYYVREVYIATLDFETGKLLDRPKAMPLKAYIKARCEWSHDGQYLAFNAYMREGDAREGEPVSLCIYSVQTGEVRKILPKNLVWFGWVRWSPDDRYVFAHGSEKEGGPFAVYKIDVETGEAAKLVRDATGVTADVVNCSPEGKSIFYTMRSREADTKRRWIVVQDLESRREKELYSDPNLMPFRLAVSPDGQWLAFTTHHFETGTATLNIIPTDAGESRELVRMEESGTIRSIQWMPDGRDLFFLREEHPGSSLWRVSAEGGSPQKVWHPKKLVMRYLRVHPDGRRIAFASRTYTPGLWVMENFLPTE